MRIKCGPVPCQLFRELDEARADAVRRMAKYGGRWFILWAPTDEAFIVVKDTRYERLDQPVQFIEWIG
jgi:hypothetical protein